MKTEILELRRKFREETKENITYETKPEPFYSDEYVDWLEKLVIIQSNDTGCSSDECHTQNVNNALPDGYWFYDEYGVDVTVIGIIDKWCIVEDIEHKEPYILTLEYVFSIYEESKAASAFIDKGVGIMSCD